MSGGRCYLRRRHEQLARTEISCEGKEIAKRRRNAAKLVAWTYSLRKNSINPSFRAKRGILLELVAKKRGIPRFARNDRNRSVLVIAKNNNSNHAFRSKRGNFLRAVSKLTQPVIGILRQFWRRMFRPHGIVWKLKSTARDFLCSVRGLE